MPKPIGVVRLTLYPDPRTPTGGVYVMEAEPIAEAPAKGKKRGPKPTKYGPCKK